jgi:hypothetical protein
MTSLLAPVIACHHWTSVTAKAGVKVIAIMAQIEKTARNIISDSSKYRQGR